MPGSGFSAMRAAKSARQVVGGVKSAAEEERVEKGRVACCALLQPLMNSDFMSDRAFAFMNLLELGGAEGAQAKIDAKAVWCKHSIGTEQYISTIAAADTADTSANIRELLEEPFFNMALAGHARTCSRAWCSNRKRALLTKDGLELTKELFVKVGKVNQMSAYGFIGTFGQVKAFDESVKTVLVQALKDMRESVKDEESLFNQLGRLIAGVE